MYRISEKRLLMGILLFLCGIGLLSNIRLIATPVRIFEKGLFQLLLAFGLLAASLIFLRRAIRKITN